jgi:hypothetical protein
LRLSLTACGRTRRWCARRHVVIGWKLFAVVRGAVGFSPSRAVAPGRRRSVRVQTGVGRIASRLQVITVAPEFLHHDPGVTSSSRQGIRVERHGIVAAAEHDSTRPHLGHIRDPMGSEVDAHPSVRLEHGVGKADRGSTEREGRRSELYRVAGLLPSCAAAPPCYSPAPRAATLTLAWAMGFTTISSILTCAGLVTAHTMQSAMSSPTRGVSPS